MKINYFNFRKFNDGYLITTDFGTFSYVTCEEFERLTSKTLDDDCQKYNELVSKGIIYKNEDDFLNNFKYLLRSSKRCLFAATSLFIFVVTTNCNGDCLYCQAKTSNSCGLNMNKEIADKFIKIVLDCPSESINIEFQGGEPLINFEIIKHIVTTINNSNCNKIISYSLVSNLTLLNDDMISFIKENHIGVSSSLDGDKKVHDYNRPMKDLASMYDGTKEGANKLVRNNINVGFIQTTTKYSLNNFKSIVDEYVSDDLHYIFLRSLTPVGMASERWKQLGYTPKEFIEFYSSCIEYILEINLKGYSLKEGMATIFLEKILNNNDTNYMELRSPCGASIGQMAFYPTGDIYSCDEGRMLSENGDELFKIGNINDSYDKIIGNIKSKELSSLSLLESAPECSSCIYSPYCGICPVVNYALYDDLFPNIPNNYKCLINKGILDKLFSIILSDKEDYKKVLYKWVNCEEESQTL